MKKEKDNDLAKAIEAAVTASLDVFRQELDEKLEAAVKAGVEIGAAVGAKIGAKMAVRAVEREKKRLRDKMYERRYHNTKLLLQNYRQLNEHFKNAVFDLDQAEEADESFRDIMELMGDRVYDDDQYVVKSIKESSVRTKIIMTHVNRMLDIYAVMCEQSAREDDKRHYRILKALYLDDPPVTALEIARREHIDKRTVYRNIDAAAACLTTLFFGADGIDKL